MQNTLPEVKIEPPAIVEVAEEQSNKMVVRKDYQEHELGYEEYQQHGFDELVQYQPNLQNQNQEMPPYQQGKLINIHYPLQNIMFQETGQIFQNHFLVSTAVKVLQVKMLYSNTQSAILARPIVIFVTDISLMFQT